MEKKAFSFKLLSSQKIKIFTNIRLLRYLAFLTLANADFKFRGLCRIDKKHKNESI